MPKNDRLTPRQRAFCDDYLVNPNATQAMIARAMLRFVNNLLRFLNDFEPQKCGPFSKYPARIAKDLRSAKNESRSIKSMFCTYLREISNDPSSVVRFNIVPTQTHRKPQSRAQPYGLLISPNSLSTPTSRIRRSAPGVATRKTSGCTTQSLIRKRSHMTATTSSGLA